MVVCLELGAHLHMAQLMPLPLTVSCFSKILIGFTFLVPAHPGSPGQRAVKWGGDYRVRRRTLLFGTCSRVYTCDVYFKCIFLFIGWLIVSFLSKFNQLTLSYLKITVSMNVKQQGN